MSKILTRSDIINVFGQAAYDSAAQQISTTTGTPIDSLSPWVVREQCRVNAGLYRTIKVAGGNPMHFLHVSDADSTKVAYTPDDGSGSSDIQKRCSLRYYCEKYDLDMDDVQPYSTDVAPPPLDPQAAPIPASAPPSQLHRDAAIRAKLDVIRHTMDDIGLLMA